MIRRTPELEAFEVQRMLTTRRTYEENLRRLDDMLVYAEALGVWPPADPLDAAEDALHLSQILHAYRTHQAARSVA